METGNIAKAPAPQALNAPPRTESAAVPGAVRTQLGPEASVQPLEETAAARFTPSPGVAERAALDETMRENLRRRVAIEPKTRELVFQTVDEESGEVVRQVPDEALLRLRAYARELVEKKEVPTAERVERIG